MGCEGTIEEILLASRECCASFVAGIRGEHLDLGTVSSRKRECLNFEGGIEAQSQTQAVKTRPKIGAAGGNADSRHRYMGRHEWQTPVLQNGKGVARTKPQPA